MPAIAKAYAATSGGQVHYRHLPGDGVPAVFLHQTASCGAMWERVMRALPPGRPLYAFDTPGFGGSFDPATAPSLEDYAGWLTEAIRAVGLERPHLVGHHTGAAISALIAAHDPGFARSVTLIGPGYASPDDRAAMAKRLGSPFRPNRSGAYLLKNWEYLRVGGADADIEVLNREMVGMLRAHATRAHAYTAVWNRDPIADFHAITAPLLIMCAPDDLMYPAFVRARAARPEVAAVQLSGGANFEPDLVPDEIAAALAPHFDAAERG